MKISKVRLKINGGIAWSSWLPVCLCLGEELSREEEWEELCPAALCGGVGSAGVAGAVLEPHSWQCCIPLSPTLASSFGAGKVTGAGAVHLCLMSSSRGFLSQQQKCKPAGHPCEGGCCDKCVTAKSDQQCYWELWSFHNRLRKYFCNAMESSVGHRLG